MVLIDYLEIFKVLIILRFCYFFMNYIPTQNGTFLGETLAGSNTDAVEATLKCVHYFRMTVSLLLVAQKSLPIPL